MPMQIAMFHFLAELNYPIIDRLYLSPLSRGELVTSITIN